MTARAISSGVLVNKKMKYVHRPETTHSGVGATGIGQAGHHQALERDEAYRK